MVTVPLRPLDARVFLVAIGGSLLDEFAGRIDACDRRFADGIDGSFEIARHARKIRWAQPLAERVDRRADGNGCGCWRERTCSSEAI